MKAVRRKTTFFLVSLLAMLAIAAAFTPETESQIMTETVTNIESVTVAQAVIWEE